MIYKPKYCCQCGGKIERREQTLFASGRFCRLCATDFVVQEWLPRIAVALVMLFGFAGFYGYLQSAEKPLKIASVRPVEQSAEIKSSPVGLVLSERPASNSPARTAPQNAANTAAAMPHQNAVSAKREMSAAKAENQSGDQTNEAPTYFCGAGTKKGSPCSRRVKGGGRCWQHVGQQAILPPEKLIASR